MTVPAPTALMVYNVQTWGAVGNGTTDDTAAINKAVMAMTSASPHGGILYFPPSTGGYFIAPIDNLNLGVNVTPSITVPQGYMVAGVAGYGFFTQSRLFASSTAGLSLVTNGSGILSNTQGYIFDTVPGRSIGGATLPGKLLNDVTNAVPGASPGEWLLFSSTNLYDPSGNLFAIQNWSDDDLQTAQPSDLIAPMAPNFATIDPGVVVLENGHMICAFTSNQTCGSAIQSRISTDGGRTWTLQAQICPTNSATQAFTEPHMIRLRQANTGTANRIVMVYCDADPTRSRDTVYRLAFSDDEATTWNLISTPATPTSGSMSAGLIYDASSACVFEDGASNIQVFYSRMVNNVAPEVLQQTCSGGTLLPVGSPSVIASAPVQKRTDSQYFGLGPKVIRLRTGECGLYFSATNFGRGEMHFMTSPFGLPGTWVNDRLVGAVASGATGGYGGCSPTRKAMDGLDLIHQLNGQPFSIIHYGA